MCIRDRPTVDTWAEYPQFLVYNAGTHYVAPLTAKLGDVDLDGSITLYSSHNEKNYFEIGYSLNRQFGNGGIYHALDLYNFVDNHDVNRLASTVKNKEDLFNIYTILFTMPGIPSIYYGSEYAIEGSKHNGSDADIRPCLQLCEFDSEELCGHIAQLSCVHKLKACSHGSYEQVLLRNEQFVFCRSYEQDSLYIACNVADTDYEAELPIPPGCWKDLLHATTYRSEDGSLQLTIPAKGACILYKEREDEQAVSEEVHASNKEEEAWLEEAVYAVPIFVKPLKAVSYTHLDVYKRQASDKAEAFEYHCPV